MAIKTRKEKFIIVEFKVADDLEISNEALGLYVRILSLQQNQVNVTQEETSILKPLIDKGYLSFSEEV